MDSSKSNPEINASPPSQEIKLYLDRRFGQESTRLHLIRTQCEEEKFPPIYVPIYEGKFLYLLAKIQQARRILEIGTLGGYSTAWLAEALPPEGRLISLEINPHYAAQAREHLKVFPEKQIEIRVGHAVGALAEMKEKREEPFDFIFIDADKENNALYLDWALHLSHVGTLIVIDNLLPKGAKIGYPDHEEAKAVYAFNDYLARHPLLEVAAIPSLARADGRLDGIAIAFVKEQK